MTTFGQAEFEALGLLEKKHTTTVKITTTIANDPDKLTDKELAVRHNIIIYTPYKYKVYNFSIIIHLHLNFRM